MLFLNHIGHKVSLLSYKILSLKVKMKLESYSKNNCNRNAKGGILFALELWHLYHERLRLQNENKLI